MSLASRRASLLVCDWHEAGDSEVGPIATSRRARMCRYRALGAQQLVPYARLRPDDDLVGCGARNLDLYLAIDVPDLDGVVPKLTPIQYQDICEPAERCICCRNGPGMSPQIVVRRASTHPPASCEGLYQISARLSGVRGRTSVARRTITILRGVFESRLSYRLRRRDEYIPITRQS